MLLRIKFWLLAGILVATAIPAINAEGSTSRGADQPIPHSWMSSIGFAHAKSSGLLFVSDTSNHVVDIYAAKNPTTPVGQIQGLVSLPWTLAVDKSGNLYVDDARTNEIFEFNPPYTSGPVKKFSGFWGPIGGINVDSNGTLYVASSQNQVVEFPNGHTKGKDVNLPVFPTGVTVDSHGNLICAFNGGGAAGVLRLTKASPIPKNLLIPLEASAADVLFDGSGNLVVEDLDGAYINVYPPGSTKPSKTIDDGFVNPAHMAFDASRQYLYVSDQGNNTVKAIAYPAGTVRWQLTGFGRAYGVAVSPAAVP